LNISNLVFFRKPSLLKPICKPTQEPFKGVHFETYKQLKEVAKEQDPGISKSEIYEKLLEPFHHSKRTEMDPETGKSRTLYS